MQRESKATIPTVRSKSSPAVCFIPRMTKHESNHRDDPVLVGAEKCLEILFPDEESRPGLRTFREWQARGYLPYLKIGRRTLFDPADVRAALERRFRIRARGLY